MASAGKKGKKSKGTVISLQSFLANGDTPIGTTQVSKKVRNLDGDESDDGSNSLPLVYQLPTAPRANRIFDDDSIPHRPPFIAYINNLPFDANEDDIYEFFGSINLASLRLPREDGETGRSRGFGYVELESRDDLIHVLSLPDPSIKGRRIRIELSNENDQQNRQKGNRRFEGFGNSSENRDSGNWRRDSQNNSGGYSSGGGGYSGNFDRGFNRDRKPIAEREESNTPGSWRSNSRPQSSDFSPPRKERERDHGSDRYRDSRPRNHEPREDSALTEERPKLNLKPRTLPLPEIVAKPESDQEDIEPKVTAPKASGPPAVNVFGSAKPVDTATRELEIEERLAEARRLEKVRHDEEVLNDKMTEIHIDNHDSENANSATKSWRRTQDTTTNDDNIVNSYDEQRQNDSDYNKFSKSQDRNERLENVKVKNNQGHDAKNKEENKNKRDYRNDRTVAKTAHQNAEPVLQSSNKYSGLDDESSD